MEDQLLQPEFISIPPKPKEEDYNEFNGTADEAFAKYQDDYTDYQQTYYPLDYLLEHGMRRFEDEKPKDEDLIIPFFEGKPFQKQTYKELVDFWESIANIDRTIKDWHKRYQYVYATEYDQAKEKQEQYGRLKGWERKLGEFGKEYFKHTETKLVLIDHHIGWRIEDEEEGLVSYMLVKLATYDWVNGVVEMYEINRKRDDRIQETN